MRHIVLILLLFVSAARAADFNGYVVLTSDYVFRGVTYSNGDPAVQLAGEVSFESGIYSGVWLSTVDIQNGPVAQRDLEVNYYLGYDHAVSDRTSIGVAVVFYTFPGAEGFIDYDYEEYSLNLNIDDAFWLEYAYSPDIFNTGWSTHNVEAYGQWPIAAGFVASGGMGYYDTAELSGDDFLYWQLGITRPFGPVDLDLRYHEASDWVPFISNPDRVGARFALSLRYQF